MVKVLHFADAHIDIATHGRHDIESGLPVRVLDFLKALDTIVDTAILEKVDLVVFAGDAYKDRSPSPTFQREWGRRIIRLSNAGVHTLLLVGNHDISPASGRAHTLQEFDTLEVPNVRVIYKPVFLRPEDLWGLPIQVLAIPWVFRSGLMASMELSIADHSKLNEEIEIRLTEILETWMNQLDPALPTLLTAHGSVQGAVYGNERTVMLGKDLVLPGSLIKDHRLDYVALGHIHKFQNLNPENHPPVIYSGSIERVDFGEAGDEKFFVIAEVNKGATTFQERKLNGREFFDLKIKITAKENMMEKILSSFPDVKRLRDSVVRITIEYPHDLDVFIDENTIREQCRSALEFHLIRRPQEEARLRISPDQDIASLTPAELLGIYWKDSRTDSQQDLEPLQEMARSIIQSVTEGSQQPKEVD